MTFEIIKSCIGRKTYIEVRKRESEINQRKMWLSATFTDRT